MRKYEGEPDYAAGDYDEAGRRLARWQFFRSVIGWLILINVAVYLTEIILFRASFSAAHTFFNCLALSPDEVFEHGRAWQLLTYSFLHDPTSPWHILFNMLFLVFFGIEIEQVWGTRRFVAFYLSAAVFAALCGAGIHYLIHRVSMCVGASGAVMALLMVYGLWWPNREILFMFLFPMRVWTLVLITIAIEIVSVIAPWDTIANLAHLGGLLYGFLIVRATPRIARRIERLSVVREAARASDDRRLDELLEKVHRQGIHSLTWRERRFLKKMSRR